MLQKEIIILPGTDEMSEYLARLTAQIIASAGDRQSVNIALSGGSTPKRIFDNIVVRYKELVRWDMIRFFQVDERCVPPDSPESNYHMIHQHLLAGLNFPDNHFFRIRGENDPQEEAIRYGKNMVENLPMTRKWPVFDLVLLGLGEDGHTASLFPGDTKGLHTQNCCEVTFHPLTGQKRITLTLPVLNQAKQLVFIVTGSEKAGMVAGIIQNPRKKWFPASLIRPGKGKLTWLLEPFAASGLSEKGQQKLPGLPAG